MCVYIVYTYIYIYIYIYVYISARQAPRAPPLLQGVAVEDGVAHGVEDLIYIYIYV